MMASGGEGFRGGVGCGPREWNEKVGGVFSGAKINAGGREHFGLQNRLLSAPSPELFGSRVRICACSPLTMRFAVKRRRTVQSRHRRVLEAAAALTTVHAAFDAALPLQVRTRSAAI
jgi:hypothetical protein